MPLPDEISIVEVLDEDWATVTQIRSRIGGPARSTQFASVLERMATAGKIERALEKTVAAKRNGKKPLYISFYRKRPVETGITQPET